MYKEGWNSLQFYKGIAIKLVILISYHFFLQLELKFVIVYEVNFDISVAVFPTWNQIWQQNVAWN